jgi:hypothetical protein
MCYDSTRYDIGQQVRDAQSHSGRALTHPEVARIPGILLQTAKSCNLY